MGGGPVVVSGIGTGVVVGGILGARHAFEPDHVAAVATLVEEERRPATTGISWGIGHSMPIVLLGTLSLLLDFEIPSRFTTALDVVVAGVLLVLGLRVLAGRDAIGAVLIRLLRENGSDSPDRQPRHTSTGGDFSPILGSQDEESLAVGIVHGLAGSGAIVIVLAATSTTIVGGTAFLFGFAVASIVAMALASFVWGRALGSITAIRIVAGLASVTVGLLILAESIGLPTPM